MSVLRVSKEIKFCRVLPPGVKIAFLSTKILDEAITHDYPNKIRIYVTTSSNMERIFAMKKLEITDK